MTTDAGPTSQEISNARVRLQIAARQAGEYAEVKHLALAALGPGWTPWMKLSLIDSDHRRTGNTEPTATAYKVYRGKKRLTENSVYLRRMPDGQIRQADSYEPLFGDLLQEPHPTRAMEVRGEQVPCPGYELCWSALDRYAPRSAEQLASARVKREERAIEKDAEANPLFADQVRSGQWRPEKRRHGRTPGQD
jgi:hypothetical protein